MRTMNKLKFNSQICTTKEQSKRLLDLGLKPDTADMVYMQIDGSWICVISQGDEEYIPYEDHFPAWSLHRLLYCLMPNGIKNYYLTIYKGYVVTYDSLRVSKYEVYKKFNKSMNIYDNIIDCIEWLIKEDYFNKEYLKQ